MSSHLVDEMLKKATEAETEASQETDPERIEYWKGRVVHWLKRAEETEEYLRQLKKD